MTEFNGGREYHLSGGRFNIVWLGELLNFRSEDAILWGKVSASGQRISFTVG